ncbi:PRONE domain [Dillenia turbinata]|uniref:PRONE domain n=1 Tax=Dillenia turbinata TaxID=194707 RepID=A0AAN8UMD0_9MAGN
MGSISSEDNFEYSERFESYSLSADVSESESSSSFSCHGEGASTSLTSSPLTSSLPLPGASGLPQPSPLIFPVTRKDVVWSEKPEKCETDLTEVEQMKERFAKLLLGEDMSGGGKGVCTALAISNAITNLSATVFGELWRLEPMVQQKRLMWCREMEWLLCVSDSIVELIPTVQESPGGGTFEVMASRPRSDLYMNLPALKKLDAMLIGILDGFRDTEFWYVDRGIIVANGVDRDGFPSGVSGGRPSTRQEEKWWLPCPRVPPSGLSDEARKRLQQCRDCSSQILKAAMAINSSVLAEMEIPSVFIEALPKSGKACLGDIIFRYITTDQFSPECLLDCLDLSTEHRTLEIANRIEAAIHVWKQKDLNRHPNHKKSRRQSWGGKVKGLVVDTEKNQFLAQRTQTLLRSLRHRFPGLPQTALDMSKIQYNKSGSSADQSIRMTGEKAICRNVPDMNDVGQAILESYSRVMESLAFNIIARIDDLLYVDDATKQRAAAESMSIFNRGGLGGLPLHKRISPSPFSIHHTPYTSPFATPTFCSSTPVAGSPRRVPTPLKSILKGPPEWKVDKPITTEYDSVWSYTGNLGSRKVSDAPERD